MNDNDNSPFPEIAKVHYNSARKAFEGVAVIADAERRKTELQVAIGHLHAVFFACQEVAGKKRNAVSAFVNSAAITERKVQALSRSVEVAALISVTYAEVGMEPSAKMWRDDARRQFAACEPLYRKYAKGHSYVATADPHRKAVFMEHVFQRYLERLESERSQLEQVFQEKGIA